MTEAKAPDRATLAKKLSEVMASIGYIPKTGFNKFHQYKFVTDADVLDTVRTKLAERGVTTTVSITGLEHLPYRTTNDKPEFLTTVYGVLSFRDDDAEISVSFCGTGSDAGDKGYYKAVTGGLKYALLKTFLVPTGDDPERDEKAGETEANPTSVSASSRTSATNSTASTRTSPNSTGVGLTAAQKGKLFAEFDRAGLKGEQRRWFIYNAVSKMSTTQMTSADMDKILELLTTPAGEGYIASARDISPDKPAKTEATP